jgi:diacylglycerol kinase (ATP)
MLAPRTTVIVNPKSQGGKLGKRWAEIGETLRRAFPFDEAVTQSQGDATGLAREALRNGAERIVAIGGDGTINEVVNGFFDERGAPINPDASFALIPFGTGGDFRRTFDLPKEVDAAAAVIAANRRRRIDVGKLTFTATNGERTLRMFANIASFGVSGVVDRLVNESGKKFGRMSFMFASMRATWSYKNQRVQLTFDGKDRVEATINTVAVANGKYFGGGMRVAPDAEPDDGQFDVTAIGDLSFGATLKLSRKIYKGTHIDNDKITARRARVVEAEALDPDSVVELDVDGESPGRLPAKFEIVPNAIWFVVPEAPPPTEARSGA